MRAIEPVLQVYPRFADDVVCPQTIVVHHSDEELCVQWEGHGEFKHPENIIRQSVSQSDGRVRTGAVHLGKMEDF